MDDHGYSSQDARVEELWKALDTQGRGQLDLDGLRAGLKRLDHPLKNADKLLEQVHQSVDSDRDGFIQYSEFRQFVQNAENQLRALFRDIDQDKNNKLTKAELREAFTASGVQVSTSKLNDFFEHVDSDHDGVISYEEWRDFLLFIPADVPGLKAVISYYTATVKVNPEGDVQIGEETVEGLGKETKFSSFLFRIFAIPSPPRIRHRPPDSPPVDASDVESKSSQTMNYPSRVAPADVEEKHEEQEVLNDLGLPHKFHRVWQSWKPVLTALLPDPGYFLAGGIAGIVSRTSTAPLDRLKVYLIAQTNPSTAVVDAVKQRSVTEVPKSALRPLIDASKALWRAGGIQSLFAGNGLNVVKVMPESAIKFGSYEASKRLLASFEGHGDPKKLNAWSGFAAGGMGGIISQFFVYPLDTLKFRMQCETVEGGLHGNKLIATTAKKMWSSGGIRPFYRGLPMGLVGMFPYSAIDLTTFESLKKWSIRRNARKRNCSEENAAPGAVTTAFIGGFSGAFGASLVYPINLLRTRLQTQGTATHTRTYTGLGDCIKQTIHGEGVRGLFKGLTPNLLKVVPAVSITYVVYESSKKALHLH
ncbi:MAG: hypothetical protein M1831_003579 [Alyxoria varia]|nr:MAG: hypothetical protein M1831_003579 [Alyxoria varia]